MFSARLRALPLILAAGATLHAQTTGTLQGRVVDSKQAPVAGATVRVSGANLQGTRTMLTGDDGSYRFGLLPPGGYTVTASKEGLNTSKTAVQVGLDKTASVDLAMAPVASATVEVVESITTVDVKGTTSGQNFTNQTFQNLPIKRDFAAIALLAPGVTEDREGFKVYGGTGAENSYVVDGINTTGAEFGTQGKTIPVEFIQEFQVKTGGYEAEYGKATGGIINVITKSGGNEFSGDAFAYSEGQVLKSGNKHENDGDVTQPLTTSNKSFDFGFDFGGPIIKDALWFFVAYDRRSNRQEQLIRAQGPSSGDTAPTDSDRDLFAGKLTWKITGNQTLIASVLGDPQKITGAVNVPKGSQSTWDGEHKVGGTDLSLRYEIGGDSWFGQVQVSRHKETNSNFPGAGGNQIQYVDNRTVPPPNLPPNTPFGGGAESGGFGRIDDKDFTRDNITGSFTKFFNAAGSHELKLGFDLQTDKADITRYYTGGQQVTIQSNPNPATNGANPFIYSHYYWTSGDAFIDANTPANSYVPSIVFASKPKHESQAFFIQDKWSITSNLVLNLGVRTDQTKIKDQFGNTSIDLKNEWAPRVGLIYDFVGKGQDKLYASFSRFYEQVPLDLVIRSFSVERNPTIVNYDPTSTVINTQAEQDINFDTTLRIVGLSAEPVDHDLKGQYSDEIILGAETTVDNLYVLGAKYVRRYLGRAIEDGFDQTLGDYFVMNPGQSHGAGVSFPEATREYRGIELTAQRKFANHYTWQMSYLWSKLKGNYEGAFQGIGGADGTGQLDPNITAAFDLPEFLVNRYGRLSGDREHQLKANGYYEWDMGLSVGANLVFQTGTPITRLGYHDGYGRYELFLDPRGTDGTTPSTTRLDLNLAYTWRITKGQQLRFMMDVTNILDSQTVTVVDQRYNFAQTDVGQTNANYKGPYEFQAPRSVRLGIRYSF